MKKVILSFTLIFALNWAFAQTGAITNIQVSQGTGENERVVNIQFDLTGNDPAYAITLEVSFDNGETYVAVDPAEITGATLVAPGTGLQLVWDGRISYSGQSTLLARIKIIATTSFICGDQITDIDGNVYNTLLIGTQCWMKENLKTTKDAVGNSITRYCSNNNPSNCDIYGGLYTWTTAMNGAASSNNVPSGVQGICPDGWHVPSDAEWTALTNYISSQSGFLCNANTSFIGKSLAAQTNWQSSANTCAVGNNLSANNATGFSGLPGGLRDNDGSFYYVGVGGFWWTSSEGGNEDGHAWLRYLYCIYPEVYRDGSGKVIGFSVRCLRD
jgi:uncharacterized protein (TIGR02145 family)